MPTARDAFIGLAIGLALFFFGIWLSPGLLRWAFIGLGVLFVLVMSAYLISLAWPNVAPPAQKLVRRARGHTRTFPDLGTLFRDVKLRAWEGAFTSSGRTIEFLIRGDKEPPPALVARAREVLAEWPALERRISEYLEREAVDESDPEIASEIRALRVATLFFDKPDLPDEVMIHFDGPDEIHYWTCQYAGGELKDLGFDSN
jgi:hypothetical protein